MSNYIQGQVNSPEQLNYIGNNSSNHEWTEGVSITPAKRTDSSVKEQKKQALNTAKEKAKNDSKRIQAKDSYDLKSPRKNEKSWKQVKPEYNKSNNQHFQEISENRKKNPAPVAGQIAKVSSELGLPLKRAELEKQNYSKDNSISKDKDFNHSVEEVLKREGGFVNDSGGMTNKGISMRFLEQTSEWKNKTEEEREKFIENISEKEAKELYKKYFWDAHKLDEYPSTMRTSLFSAYVNMSPLLVNKALQRTVGATADGKIGAKTIIAAKDYKKNDFENKFAANMLKNYSDLGSKVIKNGDDAGKNHDIYMNGWWNRFVNPESISGQDIFSAKKGGLNLRDFTSEERNKIADAYDGTTKSLKEKAEEILKTKQSSK